MPDTTRTPDLNDALQTPQNDSGAQDGSTPRIPSATPTANTEDGGAQSTGYVAKMGEYLPQGISGYFVKPTHPLLRRLNSVQVEDDDDIRSTTTDMSEMSTRAQAGSVAPSSRGSPWPSPPGSPGSASSTDIDIERSAAAGVGLGGPDPEAGDERSDADASPFWNQDHDSAEMPSPPQINLAPRTHPLGGEGAVHGGVSLSEEVQAEMDEERAEGTRAPAYDGAEEFVPDEEDDYSSDEAREDGKVKKLVKRVKGGAKVIGGRIKRDKESVEKGKDMISEA